MNRSNDGFKILEPFNIKALLSINTVISQALHNLVSNSKLFFNETIDGFEEFVRKGFDFRSRIFISIKNIVSVDFSCLIVFSEVHVSYLETVSDDRVDDQCLLTSNLCDANGDLIHLTIVILIFFILLLLLFALLILVELARGFNVREKSDLIISRSFGKLDQSIISRNSPSFFSKGLFIITQIVKIFSLSLEFLIDDGTELADFLQFAEIELGSSHKKRYWGTKANGWQNSS